MTDPLLVGSCCDPVATLTECYSYPKTCASLTNWAASCGCCGETYILADLSAKTSKGSCSLLTIKDGSPVISAPGTPCPRFSLVFKFGCVTHTVTLCNLPSDIKQWSSFVYTVLATDAVLLQNNVKIVITASDTASKSITMQICVDCPGLSILMAPPIVGPVKAESTPVVMTNSAPKLGQFVAYGYTSGILSGVKTYDASLPYAGFLNLPKNTPLDACCLPTSCDCNAIGGCQTIQRTGKTLMPLAIPFPSPTATLVLATKVTGEIAVFSGALDAGYTAFPFPYSFVLDPASVGSTIATVILH